MLAGLAHSNAQDICKKQNLLQSIESRDSIMDELKKKELPDSLRRHVADFRALVEILNEEIRSIAVENDKLKCELNKYQILTSPDSVLFKKNFPKIIDIPACLHERVDLIISVIELRTKIENAEKVAQELEQMLGDTPVAYAAIRERLESDLDEIQGIIHKIKRMNLSLLSEEQQKYFRPGLTDRYNNFGKYF